MKVKSNILPIMTEEEAFKVSVLRQIRAQDSELSYDESVAIFLENFPEFLAKPDMHKLIKALFKNQRNLEARLNQLIQGLQTQTA